LCHVPNDIEKLLPASPDFDPKVPPEPSWFNPDSSYLMHELYQRIILPRKPTVYGYHDWLADGYADPMIYVRHEQQLEAIIRACNERGITLRVVLLPFVKTQGDRFDQREIHARLEKFFRNRGVSVVNLLPIVSQTHPQPLVVNGRDPHPNEFSHGLFADAIGAAFYANSDKKQPKGGSGSE